MVVGAEDMMTHTRRPADVAVYSFGRTRSERCPNKMLRPFGGTTLTDIILSKLARITAPTFFAGFESAFAERCARYGVRFVQRDERSATIDEPIIDILSFLRPLEFSHLLCVNASLPFLEVGTIEAFLEDCLAHDRQPAFGVIQKKNHLMTLDRKPINFDIGARTINTKTIRPVIEFAHCLYFYSKEYFFREATYWDWNTVRLVEIGDKLQTVDIDTEEEFRIAEALWRGLHASPPHGPAS
jgi:CMP-N-acetylneuraminic acid synthetase